MGKKLFIIVLLFLLVRGLTVIAYKDTYFYYGMVSNQFAIAEAAYNGHWFSQDKQLVKAVSSEAYRTNRYIPIEEWKNYKGSGVYTTFPAQDLPGFGYLIAFTSKYISSELTSRYAFAVQIIVEMASVLLFVCCVRAVFSDKIAFMSGLIYIFAYPFIWPIASQPMRDVFVLGVYSFYIAAIFIFFRWDGVLPFLAATSLVVLSSLLLWVRPSGYYFFFTVPFLVLFRKGKSIRSRVAFFLVSISVPLFIFGYQFKHFNIRHYGVADTDMLGRALWEGMGIVEDNPYGFALDDATLVPWVKSYYNKDVEYSSPGMNKFLGDYAREVIRKDPLFYMKTVLVRCVTILKGPLNVCPASVFSLVEPNSPIKEYIRRHPASFTYFAFFKIAGIVFFYSGSIIAIMMLLRLGNIRLELLLLLSPFFYTLATQIPLHFESRYLATGAWVLVLPIAWFIEEAVRKKVS